MTLFKLTHCSFWIFLLVFLINQGILRSEANTLYRDIASLAPIGGCSQDPNNDDLSLVKRIIKAYQLTASDQENRGNSMWQMFFYQRHLPIHQIFKSGQFDKAAAILRDPSSSELFYGFDNLTISIQPWFSDPKNVFYHAIICLDTLLRFGEVIGAIGYYHPTQPRDAQNIVEYIETFLGQTINFPNPYPNEYGVITPRGIASYRAPQALYQAWRIKQLTKGIDHPRVLEIGAGVGRTAYYAYLFGIEDYTIVDLPFTALSSGYFLGCTLGENQVVLSGETTETPEKCIKFLTPAEFLVSDEKYDLIINVDSMTEMDQSFAQAYWNKIESNSRVFLSINHELNPFSVKTIIDGSSRVERSDRLPYWMRNGYFEEIVRFKP